MFSTFQMKVQSKELRNLRLLNVFTAVIVTLLGFLFEFVYHDGSILASGLAVSMIFTLNYFLSFYSRFFRENFTNITFASIFLLNFWAVYVAFVRRFDTDFLLPVSISVFTFSLIFNRFYKSMFFIFSVTTFMFILMLLSGNWRPQFTITLIALYSGAFLAEEILKRKTAYRNEIAKQERRYLTLVSNMNDGLIYLGKDHIITSVNQKFTRITGYSESELAGKSLAGLFPDAGSTSSVGTFFDELAAGMTVRSEAKLNSRQGQPIWIQMSGAPVTGDDGNVSGAMVVCSDITALKNTQEMLKKREEGYRTFIDQSAVGIWKAEYPVPVDTSLPVDKQIDILLESGVISECNDFMARMYGYNDSSELVGRKIRDFYHIESNLDDEKTRELLTQFITNNYRISNAESKELDKFGSVRIMLNNNMGIVENGFLIRTWGVQTDITDRKRTEHELLQSNQELDTFFYKASHDLKGPLASVMGIVNLARLENHDQLMEKYFGMIESSIQRLDRTLLDLIELARTRKGSSKVSVINMKEMVEEIIGSISHLPGFGKINFEVKVDHHTEIIADKVLVLSVFQNLIHNAVNYCNQESPWIRITATRSGNGIVSTVADNGKGIPAAIQDKVFDMFYRGNAGSPGSGLGLFIVRNALDKMKGSVSFTSEPGHGTTFTVKIPDNIPLV